MTTEIPSPESWGIRPVLFRFGHLDIPSYGVFVALGLAVGLLVYALEAYRNKTISGNTFYILLAAIFGGALGAKIPIIVVYFRDIFLKPGGLGLLVSGRSILGGMVGGAVCIALVKRWLGIRERKGNLFAAAIAAGMAIGRIGCFLRGCCYGTPTTLPWGVDFGDGIARHPTQLYESVFMLALFIALTAARSKPRQPAVLFWVLMFSYSLFRFFEEFIRTEEPWLFGLTFFQWICLALALVYGRMLTTVRTEEDEYHAVR